MNARSSSTRLLALTLLLLALAGCRRASAPAAADGTGPAPTSAAGGGEVAVAALPAGDRSLVVTMSVALTVEGVDDATARIRGAVERAGGFVADQHTRGAGGDRWAHLELRVPADKARAVRGSLDELGEITSFTEKAEDVTEQRADLEARLRNARVQEKRVLELLSGKAASISELVEAEKELARVRENVERLEAQERVMRSKIQLASVSVTLSTRTVPVWQTPGESLAQAGRSGTRRAAAVAVYSGMAFLTVAPTLLPVAAVVVGVILAVRRRRRPFEEAVAGS